MSTSATTTPQQITTSTATTDFTPEEKEVLMNIGMALQSIKGSHNIPHSDQEKFDKKLRQGVYLLVQSNKKNDETGAFYNELQCPIHMGLIGNAGHNGTGNDPITFSCGHSFCRGCVQPIFNHQDPNQRRCPTCRAPLQNPATIQKNQMIGALVDRLKPPPSPQQGHHGGRRKKRKTTRKNKKY